VADLLQELNDRVQALGGEWTRYSVVGSFLLYVVGYLALRFHLTAIGIGTDLAVLDERYLFTGARFLVSLVASVPNILLVALMAAAVSWTARQAAFWAARRALPAATRQRVRAWILRVRAWILQPTRLALFGIVFAVVMIQFLMRQCFVLNDLLLARELPANPAWLVKLLFDDRLMALYFSALVAGCAVSIAILIALRDAAPQGSLVIARRLLAFLATVQFLLLPINYGVLIVDKALPRVAALGDTPLSKGDEAWLVWEGKDGVTFLLRNQERTRRTLLTLQRADVKRTEILGFDRILPTLFGEAIERN
jgi:hypothetical protein